MRPAIREKIDRLGELYPPERLALSKERIRRVWRGEPPLDRLPFVLIPPGFSYYDDVFEPEEGLTRYLDEFLRRGIAGDDYIPAFFTGCRMGAMPSLFGAKEAVRGGDYSCLRLLTDEASVRALPEPRILPGSPAKAWLDAQRYYLEETEGAIPVHVNDMQGPLDVCGQLWGYENVLAEPYEDEELYDFLLGRVTDGFLLLWNEQKRILRDALLPTHLYAWDWVPPDNGATLSADSLVMLSPDFFRRWYKPALERVSPRARRADRALLRRFFRGGRSAEPDARASRYQRQPDERGAIDRRGRGAKSGLHISMPVRRRAGGGALVPNGRVPHPAHDHRRVAGRLYRRGARASFGTRPKTLRVVHPITVQEI